MSMTADEFRARYGGKREKSAKRTVAGKQAQSGGKQFEQDLDRAHAAYQHVGLARIEHLPVPTSPMPKSMLKDPTMAGRARLLSTRQGFDYYGTLGPASGHRGRAVAMEAKRTADYKTSIPVVDKSSGIRTHQLEACATSWRDFGTVAVIVWRNGDLRGVLLPDAVISAWQDIRLKKRASIPWRAFVPFTEDVLDEGGRVDHWLGPVLAWMKEAGA